MVNKIKSFKFYKRFYQNWWISFLFDKWNNFQKENIIKSWTEIPRMNSEERKKEIKIWKLSSVRIETRYRISLIKSPNQRFQSKTPKEERKRRKIWKILSSTRTNLIEPRFQVSEKERQSNGEREREKEKIYTKRDKKSNGFLSL